LPSEKQEQIEELLLTDEEYYEEILIVEDELVDDYLRDKLSADEQKHFRQHFLSTPERYEKLRVARAFKRYLDEKAAETTSGLKPASWWSALLDHLRFPEMSVAVPVALVLLSIALGAFWIINKVRQPSIEMAEEESRPPSQLSPPSTLPNQNIQEAKETGRPPVQVAEQEANRNGAPERRPEKVLRNTPARTSTLAVALTPGMLRSEGAIKDVNLSQNIDRLQLKLSLTTNDYRRYRAVLQTADGRDILSRDGLKRSDSSHGPAVILTVPAKLLSAGEYRLTLSGATPDNTFETAGQYYFKINKN
jgi:hypothetical protein